ncbi:MAG: hypothetical protein MK554_13915, partial [Planctomycetes bacterium]|nr:hypothetical protein [Planctomycetota bacterium]
RRGRLRNTTEELPIAPAGKTRQERDDPHSRQKKYFDATPFYTRVFEITDGSIPYYSTLTKK